LISIDLQTFLGSKIIEEEVKKEEENFMALPEDRCLQQLSIRYNINTKIQDILSTITTFGSVSIETSPPSVVIKTTKDKHYLGRFVGLMHTL
jgi:LPS O-antigen subunit length determinant protein (WzzB/FepE family)